MIIFDEYFFQYSKKQKVNDYFEAFSKVTSEIEKLQSKGFIAACYDSIIIENKKISAFINIGEKFLLTNFEINKSLDLKTIQKFQKKKINKPVDIKSIENINNQLLEHFVNNGYPFAEITYDSLLIDKSKMSIKVNINEHKLYKIDTIFLIGDIQISKKYITNIIEIQEKSIYNEKKINNIQSKLAETEFINETSPTIVEFHPNDADLYIFIEREKSNIFDGIIGFVPDETNQNKLSLTGDVNLKIKNAFRQGEILKLKWQKYQANTQNLDVYFNFPYLFGTPFGIEENIIIDKIDTSLITINNLLNFQFFLNGLNYISTFVSSTKSITLGENESSEIQNLSSNIYGVIYFYQNLDYKFNPKKGYSLKIKSGYGKKIIENNQSSKQIENEINIELYVNIYKKFVIKTENYSGIKTNKNGLYANELFLLGGLKTFRGFDEKSIQASAFCISSIEIRYLFEKKSNIYLFYDFGYFERKTVDSRQENYAQSLGIGLNFSTKAGIFSLNYAFGKFDKNPFIFKNAKVHFGFISIF